MAEEPTDLILHRLNKLDERLQAQAREIRKGFSTVEKKLEDMATGVVKMGGITFQSDARLDNVDHRIEALEAPLAKLEEKA